MRLDFKVIEYRSTLWEEAVSLREKILRKPLGKTFSEKELEEESSHYHIVGLIENKLVATAVLVPESNSMKMQRVVVESHLRNLNIGSELMVFCEAIAKKKNNQLIYCHARDTAVNFYLKNNYLAVGDYFEEDSIPHLKMEKKL